jgi:hypothetical protein
VFDAETVEKEEEAAVLLGFFFKGTTFCLTEKAEAASFLVAVTWVTECFCIYCILACCCYCC